MRKIHLTYFFYTILIISISCKKSSNSAKETTEAPQKPSIIFSNEVHQGELIPALINNSAAKVISATILGLNCYAAKQNDSTVTMMVPITAPIGSQKIEINLDGINYSYPINIIATNLEKPAATIINNQLNSVIDLIKGTASYADSLKTIPGYDYLQTKIALVSLKDSLAKYKSILLNASPSDQLKAAAYFQANEAAYLDLKSSLAQIGLQTKEITKISKQINQIKINSKKNLNTQSAFDACKERLLFNQMNCLVIQHLESIRKIGKWAVVYTPLLYYHFLLM